MITHANPPERCDLCEIEIFDEFYDAKTVLGPWANMCPGGFVFDGIGTGVGLGQHYRRENGSQTFIKVQL